MARSHFILFLVFLFSALAFAGPVKKVDVAEIACTQSEVGEGNVTQILRDWAKQANGSSDAFFAFLKGIVENKPFPAVEGPDLWGSNTQRIYLLDGHHRASAIYRVLNQKYSSLPPELQAVMSAQEQKEWRLSEVLKLRVEVGQSFPIYEV